MTHLEIIVIMCVVALGAWVAMDEGMILEPWRKWVVLNLPMFLQKPLATCPRCMVSGWGIPAMYAFGYNPDLYMIPFYLLCAVALQELLHR